MHSITVSVVTPQAFLSLLVVVAVVSNPTPLNIRSTMGAAYVEDTWRPLAGLEVRGGLRFESTYGWNEAHGRASIYGFTNGVVNSTPSTGGSGLTDNRALFLPEPRIGLTWNVAGRNQTSVRANYTFSKNLDDGSAWNTSVSANTPAFVSMPSLPSLDYGRAATDVCNAAALNATASSRWANAVVFTSSTAQSPTTGVITAAGASRLLQLGLKLLF